MYDANHAVVAIPDNVGRREVTKPDGEKSFCYSALHTHDSTGTLHIQIAKGNDLMLGTFLSQWNAALLKGKISVNGRSIKNPKTFQVKSGMLIEISL